MEDPTIGDLFLRACGGDRAAAEALVRALSGMVVAVVRRSNVDAAYVEDVASSVWLKLFEHCDRIRDPESVPGWLRTTARNESMQWHRSRGREAPSPTDNLPDHGEDEEGFEAFENDEEMTARRSQLRRVWGRVDRRCKRLIDLKTRVPLLTNQEVAASLGMPIGSVGPTYRRCLDKLRAMLAGSS